MMKFLAAALLLTTWLCPPALAAPVQKKLIKTGWDSPSPTDLRSDMARFEALPFDGVAIRWPDNHARSLFRPGRTDPATLQQFYADLAAIEWGGLTDNFIAFITADYIHERLDWFDDAHWASVEHNTALALKAARLARCRGLIFDPEDYGKAPWSYPKSPSHNSKTIAEHIAQVRARGARWMTQVQAQLPDAVILFYFTPDDHTDIAEHNYGLLTAFINGMLDAAAPGVRIIDGNEGAYYHTAEQNYLNDYHHTANRKLQWIDPALRDTYHQHMRVGSAVYIDYIFPEGPRKQLGQFLTPQLQLKWLEHNTYWALRTTDEFVWVYSEDMNWWTGAGVPIGAVDAMRSARRHVARQEPPDAGFNAILAAAKTALDRDMAASMQRRSATITRTATPPTIDGLADDAAWRNVEPLEPFVSPAMFAPVDYRTEARVTFDDDALYVMIACDEPNMDKLRIWDEGRDDANLWRGDVVEIFISQPGDAYPFYHFMVNAGGGYWDSICTLVGGRPHEDRSWNPTWRRAGSQADDRWYVEAAIPWRELNMTAPRTGDMLRANIGRHRHQGDNFNSMWSPPRKSFQEADRFGEWTFEGDSNAGASTGALPIRAGWMGVTGKNGAAPPHTLDEMKRRGMNAVLLAVEGMSDDDTVATFSDWAGWTAERGMMLFPVMNLYNVDDVDRNPIGERHYVDSDGKAYPRTPCPADQAFWDAQVTRWFTRLAEWSNDKPSVRGLTLDTEMYGANRASYISNCHCRFCAKEAGGNVTDEASVNLVRRNVARTAAAVWEINPNLHLTATLLDHYGAGGHTPSFYKAMTIAWGKPGKPVLVLSEALYEPGFHAAFAHDDRPLLRPVGSYIEGRPRTFGIGDRPAYVDLWVKRYAEWGAHAQFVGAPWLTRIPAENLAENLYHMAAHTGGYWIYDMGFIPAMSQPREDAHWEAIERANDELDRLANDPRYQSPLKVRPFTLPAPDVGLERFVQSGVTLPIGRTPVGDPHLFFKNTEQIIMFAAAKGDDVALDVLVESGSASKLKEDVTGITVVDPSGTPIAREKVTIEDMLAAGRRDRGDYAVTKRIAFTAPAAGTYGLFLKSTRYIHTLAASSHAWGASMIWPGSLTYTRIDRPRSIYLKTLEGAKVARFRITAGPAGPIGLRIVNDDGDTLLTTQIVSSDGRVHRGDLMVEVPNEDGKARRLQLIFDKPARDMNIYPDQGIEPWLTAHDAGPFPIERKGSP